MSDLEKLGQAAKAAILREAEARAAEVDRDFKIMGDLAAKYGLAIVPANNPSSTDDASMSELYAKLVRLKHAGPVPASSMSARAKELAEEYIRQQNRPVLLSELHQWLETQGVKFDGDTPRNTLSAVLGQAPTLYSISRSKGWWIKGLPEPHGIFG